MNPSKKSEERCLVCNKPLGYSRNETCLKCRQIPCKIKGCKTMTISAVGICSIHPQTKKPKAMHDPFLEGNKTAEIPLRVGFVFPTE